MGMGGGMGKGKGGGGMMGKGMGDKGKGKGMVKGMGGGMGKGMGMGKRSSGPDDLYPELMSLPNMSPEQRASLKQKAHQRMLEGAAMLSQGVGSLADAAPSDDFRTMEQATATFRQGLLKFESGLAAHRAIAEGNAPRNIALEWFQRDLNLLPLANDEPGFKFFGMSVFHTSVMALLAFFVAATSWMYFYKMRRAAALLQRLTTMDAAATAPVAPSATAPPAPAPSPKAAVVPAATSPAKKSSATKGDDCCVESDVDCGAEDADSDRPDISQGLLRVVKKKLCRLRVAQIFQETADVKTFRLVACHGGGIPFSYFPGQFLTVTMPIGDKPIRRSYTISSSPTQGYYCEITVKREEQGVGSRYLHDTVKGGDTLEIQAPNGKFIFTGKEAEGVVLISGGVGITPMMSITRALTDMGWPGDIYFVVACRDPEHLIYKTELHRLAERHSNLHLVLAMSRIEKDIDGYHRGRLTKELLAKEVPDIATKWIHLCGAPPMMDGTKQMLSEMGVPSEQIHTENFGSQQKPQARTAQREKAAPAAAPEETGPTATFQTSGKSTQCLPDETILEAAERVDVDIENSCRVGMCGVCTAKLVSGEVTMEVEDGLEPDAKEAGIILTCQAKPVGDVTVEA
jgi:ferredoxin-NADP reductase